MVEQKKGMENYQGKHIVVFKNNRISFFGKTMVIDDSTHIMQQLMDIVVGDRNLSIDGKVLNIGDVGFGINLNDDGIVLISSTQVNDPKMKAVLKYLNTLYGSAREEEPDRYWWLNEESSGNTIRLCPLHSEEGGTVLLFY